MNLPTRDSLIARYSLPLARFINPPRCLLARRGENRQKKKKKEKRDREKNGKNGGPEWRRYTVDRSVAKSIVGIAADRNIRIRADRASPSANFSRLLQTSPPFFFVSGFRTFEDQTL